MTERMSRDVRRERLLKIMREQFAHAKRPADFSIKKIAGEEGVSEVWVYKLIGEEFEELRSQFVPDPATESTEEKLRRENVELRQRVHEMEQKFEVETMGNYAEAIKIIEAQDEEIRALHGLKRLYEKRLKELGMIVNPESHQENFQEDIPEDGIESANTIDLTEGQSN